MKIIILGANGLIGYNILTTFLENPNFEVLAFVRDKKKFNSFRPDLLKKLIFDFMRNISIGQIFVIFIVGVLIFSDFSKILKNVRNLVKNTKIYKNLKKK